MICSTPLDRHSSSWKFRVLSATAFFMVAISWSPLLPGLLSLNSGIAFLGTFLLFAAVSISERGISSRLAFVCTLLLIGSMILLVATQSITLWNRTAPLGLLIFAAHEIASIRRLAETVCRLLTAWLVTGVVLSIVGFIYAFTGGEPLLSIANPDGRENFLYLTTMSGSPIGSVIRPAWVYDEPGAFSFLICATVALRHMLNMSARPSAFLMLGGLITLSLTHLLIAVLFLVSRLGVLKATMLAAVLALGAQFVVPELEEFDFVTARFAIEDGRLAGDNRSNQIDNFVDVANVRIFLFGDVECHDRPDRSCDQHGDISSSPVTPTYYGGVFLLAAQLAVHTALIWAFFVRQSFRLPALILTILLLQRPYFAGFGYGLSTYVILFLMFKSERIRRRSARLRRRVVSPVGT
jgi:hypothetical protein